IGRDLEHGVKVGGGLGAQCGWAIIGKGRTEDRIVTETGPIRLYAIKQPIEVPAGRHAAGAVAEPVGPSAGVVNAKQHILRGDGVGNLHAEEHVEAQGKVAAEVLAYGIEIDGG